MEGTLAASSPRFTVLVPSSFALSRARFLSLPQGLQGLVARSPWRPASLRYLRSKNEYADGDVVPQTNKVGGYVDPIEVMQWESGMPYNRIAAMQGIRIRRSHRVAYPSEGTTNEQDVPRNILEQIIWDKEVEVAQCKEIIPLEMLKKSVENAPPVRDFIGALRESYQRTGVPGLIAEVKKASPSRGVLREDFDPVGVRSEKMPVDCYFKPCSPYFMSNYCINSPTHQVEIAKTYEKNGAACLSILTDRKYFQGGFENLEAVRKAGVKCPLLCKEFIIDRWQIYQARLMGADAVLLIAGVLTNIEIVYMTELCRELGLAVLVEVHDEREMDRVLQINGIQLIGINNRNLETFEVDIANTKKLLEGKRGEIVLQKGITIVGESGLFTPGDISYVQEAGVRAVLVGESLIKQADPGKAISVLFGKDISK